MAIAKCWNRKSRVRVSFYSVKHPSSVSVRIRYWDIHVLSGMRAGWKVNPKFIAWLLGNQNGDLNGDTGESEESDATRNRTSWSRTPTQHYIPGTQMPECLENDLASKSSRRN